MRKNEKNRIKSLTGVADVHRVSGTHKMVSQKWKVDKTIIEFDDGVSIGGKDFAIMTGSCSIEGEKQIENTVQTLVEKNLTFQLWSTHRME